MCSNRYLTFVWAFSQMLQCTTFFRFLRLLSSFFVRTAFLIYSVIYLVGLVRGTVVYCIVQVDVREVFHPAVVPRSHVS